MSGGKQFGLLRYLPNGQLDSSFGSGGAVFTQFPAQTTSIARGAVFQTDGKLVVAGSAGNAVALARYLDNGQLDTSFGSGGRVTIGGTSGFVAGGNAIALQQDGKIVVTGGSFRNVVQDDNDMLVLRCLPNGDLDATLGAGTGYVLADFSGNHTSDETAFALVMQPDGKIVVAGVTGAAAVFGGRDFAVVRFMPDGSLDGSFGTSGKVKTDFGGGSDDSAKAVVLQTDGKIVLVGSSDCCNFGPTDFGFARYNANGVPDATFGPYGNGLALASFAGFNPDSANGVALDGDGRILAAGTAFIPSYNDFALTRLTAGEYPFHGVALTLPGRIEAEDFDNGGPGVAYGDTTANANEVGGSYRSNYRPGSGVDLEADNDGGNNVHVAYIHAGEWLQYSVTVAAAGSYSVQARVASSGNGGNFHVEVDGTDKTGPMTIPNTGGYLNFQTITKLGVSLSAGQHLMRVVFDSNGNGAYVGNLNFLEITPGTLALTVSANGGGVILRSPDEALYKPNSTVSLTPLPEVGWVFSGWSGDASGTQNPLPVTMTGDKSITANFTATASACVLATPGLVGWWPGGGTAIDIIGDHNGIMMNGASFAVGEVGQAFSFDGLNQRVVVPGFGNRLPTTEITIEFWQKVSAAQVQTTVGLDPYDHTHVCRCIAPYNDGVVYWDFGDNHIGGQLSYTPPVSILGSWQHFAFVASQSGNCMKIYRNGVLEAQKTGMIPFANTGYDLALGGEPGEPYGGLLDEVSIYNRALASSEVLAIYNSGAAGKCLSPVYITSITRSGNILNVSWVAQKGITYRMQYATDLKAATAWTDVGGDVTATGGSASKTDMLPPNTPQRFYRVAMFR